MSTHHQIVIIGSGPGGYIAAIKAAQLGADVAVIEKHHLGGTCLNYGCIPSKALLSSSELLHQMHRADDYGIKLPGQPTVNWKKVQKHKDKTVRQLRAGVGSLFKGRGVSLYQGTAKLDGPGRIVVQNDGQTAQQITADKVILAFGTRPSRIPGWPDDSKYVCTSDEAVHWDELPRKLIIVGGGVIGCEFACMMQPLGVNVTVVEMLPRLLPGLDHDLGDALLQEFKNRGIDCQLGVKIEGVDLKDGQVTARLEGGRNITADRMLVATGRTPNAADIGLESVGIDTSRRGFIPVNDLMQTNIADYYCIGDANGRCLLAHAASAHGVGAVENALGADKPFTAPIPSAVYTFPEIAAVGMTEAEAREKVGAIAIGMFPIGHLGKAMAVQHREGFVKTIRDRTTDALLGVHMLGHNATECIAAAGAMLHQKASVHDLADVVFAHPTISESIKESAEDALAMGLHLPPRKLTKIPALVAD